MMETEKAQPGRGEEPEDTMDKGKGGGAKSYSPWEIFGLSDSFHLCSSWNSAVMSCFNFCLGPGQIAPPTTHPLIFPSLPLYNQTISSGAAEYHGPLAYHRFKKRIHKASHPLLSSNKGSTERESNVLEVTQLGSRGQD